jgi:hypothetical protein
MGWVSIGSFNLTREWVFTQPIDAQIFRIKHTAELGSFKNSYLKAVVATAFIDEGQEVNIFEPKRLSYRQEREIFTFYYPAGIRQQTLAFKRLDKTDFNWIIEAEFFRADSQQDDFANYLTTRFGEIMFYLIERGGASNINPNSGNFGAKTTVERLLEANSNRRALIIRTSNHRVEIYAGKNQDGTGKTLIESVGPNGLFQLPNNNGVYQGDIFVQSKSNESQISYTEYNG